MQSRHTQKTADPNRAEPRWPGRDLPRDEAATKARLESLHHARLHQWLHQDSDDDGPAPGHPERPAG